MRRPSTIPSTAWRATSSTATNTCSGARMSAPSLPAMEPNSVCTGPGARQVTETPLGDTSACTASESVITNAFVAE